MYVWLAIDVDEQLKALRSRTEQVTAQLACFNSALTLPLHISLRMSFPIEDAAFESAVNRIERWYRTLSPFQIAVQGMERNRNVVWLKIAGCPELERLHSEVVRLLQEEYGIGLHPFDQDFRFHASLFLNSDENKAAEAFSLLQNESLPFTLTASRFVIGCSETGRAGEYRVIRTIER